MLEFTYVDFLVVWHAGLKLSLRVRKENLIFFFLNQNICCGYSKEPSHGDGSYEHPKHMLKLMVKIFFLQFYTEFFLKI